MFCRNCGAQNNDNSNFCRECGSPLKAPEAAAVAENVAETVQEAAPAVEAAAAQAVQDVAETVENTAESAAEAANEAVSEAETKAEDVAAQAAAEAAIAGEAVTNAAENVETQAEATISQAEEAVAQADTTVEQAAENITEEAEEAEESSAAPVAGAAAVAAVAAELVSESQAKAAEPAPQAQTQPRQYAPQQGQYQQQPAQYQQPQQQVPPQQGYYSNNAQAAATAQAQPKQPKPPKKKAGAGRVILTIFLSLFLIIFFTVCIVEYCALKTINKDNISDALKETDLSRMVLDSDGEELSLVEVIEEKADIKISEEFDITDEQLEEIMDTPTVKKFISDNLADMAESVLNGEEPEGISKKSIIDYVKKNKKSIYKDLKELGGDFNSITMEDIDNFEEEYGDQLDDAFDTIGTDKIDMDFIAEETGMDFDISRYIKLIPILKWIAPGLAALFIILMLLGNIGYESLTGKGVGISAMIAGAFTAGAAIAFKYILDIPDTNVLKVLGLPMAELMMIVGGIAFGAGLLLLIITCIIKAIATRARERRAA